MTFCSPSAQVAASHYPPPKNAVSAMLAPDRPAWRGLIGVLSALAILTGTVAGAATNNAATHPAEVIHRSVVEADIDEQVEALLAQMTMAEKVGQLRLMSIGQDLPRDAMLAAIARGEVGAVFNSVTAEGNRELQQAAVNDSRLGIPLFFAYDVVHGHRTQFPIGPGLASTWNTEAVERAASVMAREASADGLDATFAPVVDISRDPRWGRVAEGFGEDPYLVSQMARAMVRGLQGDDLSDPDRIMATVKHFALYGAVEGGRDYNVVDMSLLRMHQDFLPPYRAAIDEGAGAVMVALNTVNGVPASANTWLLRELLRDDWGFDGLVLSDHGAIDELMRHGVAANGPQAATLALAAGLDMSMADQHYQAALPALLSEGKIEMSRLDDAVRRVLRTKFRLGLFSDPFRRIGSPDQDPADIHDESRLHRSEALELARQSLVLLKNRDQTLPIPAGATVALVGPLADSAIDIMGSWSAAGRSEQAVTVRAGMLDLASQHEVELGYAQGANVLADPDIVESLNQLNWDQDEIELNPRGDAALIAEAVELAEQADVVVAVVGEARSMSHESSSRTSLTLPGQQTALIEALAATGKPLVVVVLSGRPLALTAVNEHADALIQAWYPGTEGGNAVAEVLYGMVNPSGHLPLSLPRSVGHLPAHYNVLALGRPYGGKGPGNYTSHYFDAKNGPLYAFGHGLSYTDFSLSPIRLSATTLGNGESATATVTLRNDGKTAGATVVQLYVRDEVAPVVQPIRSLRGFQRVQLQPGEEKDVEFEIDASTLAIVNAELERVAEPGSFLLRVGLSSDAGQEARLEWVGPAEVLATQ